MEPCKKNDGIMIHGRDGIIAEKWVLRLGLLVGVWKVYIRKEKR